MKRPGPGYRIVFFLAAGMALAAFALMFFERGDTRHALTDATLAALSLWIGIHSYGEARDLDDARARRTSSTRRSL